MKPRHTTPPAAGGQRAATTTTSSPAWRRARAGQRRTRYKVIYGGLGSGKSWGVARALLSWGANQPLRILCAREIQRTVADSVHRVLADQIVAMGLEDFYVIQESSIARTIGLSAPTEPLRVFRRRPGLSQAAIGN